MPHVVKCPDGFAHGYFNENITAKRSKYADKTAWGFFDFGRPSTEYLNARQRHENEVNEFLKQTGIKL